MFVIPIAEFKRRGWRPVWFSERCPEVHLSCGLPPWLLPLPGSDADQQADVYGVSKCAGSTFQTGAVCRSVVVKDYPVLRM